MKLNSDTSKKDVGVRERMPRGVKKENLPQKVCEICEKPFTWRKKWEDCWEEVKTCSNSCKNKRKLQKRNRGTIPPESEES
jgi:hypothetical protein